MCFKFLDVYISRLFFRTKNTSLDCLSYYAHQTNFFLRKLFQVAEFIYMSPFLSNRKIIRWPVSATTATMHIRKQYRHRKRLRLFILPFLSNRKIIPWTCFGYYAPWRTCSTTETFPNSEYSFILPFSQRFYFPEKKNENNVVAVGTNVYQNVRMLIYILRRFFRTEYHFADIFSGYSVH